MVDTLPSHVQVQLDDRLIPELARFFGGRTAALREVLQNAYRAGAKNVTATIDGNILVVEDDGEGCPDPQLLLWAGKTGWDEALVTEPAGLGFYSLLHPEVSTSVQVQSRNWSITLLPKQVLAKKPSRVEPAAPTDRGFRLRIMLVSADRVREDLEEVRGYYPFRFTINGDEVPVTQWQPTWTLETPVGKVGVRHRSHRENYRAIWEYRPIAGEAFENALDRVQAPLAQAIVQSCSIHWFVDPQSGVAAKLPDRNDLDESAALEVAAATILKHIELHFMEEARKASSSWPDILPKSTREPSWLFQTTMGETLLANLGWRPATRDCHEDGNLYYIDNDGWENDNGSETTFTRQYVAVAEPWVADSINNAIAHGAQLPWAVVDAAGLMPKVIKPRKPKQGGRAWISLAKEIRLGKHRLPFLLPAEESGPMVLACEAEMAVAAVMGKDVTLPSLTGSLGDLLGGYAAANFDQLYDGDWGDYDREKPDWDLIDKDLIEQVSKDFIGGARAKARQHLHHLQSQSGQLRSAQATIAALDERPSVLALRKAVDRVEKDLKAEIKRTGAKARLPA